MQAESLLMEYPGKGRVKNSVGRPLHDSCQLFCHEYTKKTFCCQGTYKYSFKPANKIHNQIKGDHYDAVRGPHSHSCERSADML